MLLPTLLLIAAPPAREVAVIARIYYPPGDKRMSHHEVYLCDIHGKHLRKISHLRDDADDVHWRDRNHLEWTTLNYKGSHTRWSLDFASGKVKQIPTDDSHNLSGLQGIENSPESPEPPKFEYRLQSNSYTVQVKGQDKTFTLPDRIISDFFDGKHNLQWIETWTHDSSSGNHYNLYALDWSTGKRRLVVENSDHYEFSPTRDDIYVAVKPFDDGASGYNYGKGHAVYTARAWAGNWKTGKTWVILGGLVWANSISLRPLK